MERTKETIRNSQEFSHVFSRKSQALTAAQREIGGYLSSLGIQASALGIFVAPYAENRMCHTRHDQNISQFMPS